MKTSYEIFTSNCESRFEALKKEYDEKVKNAKNKKLVNNEFFDALARNEYTKIQNGLGENSRILISIKDELERDVNLEERNLFNKSLSIIPPKKRKVTFDLLVELRAMDYFFEYWNNLELNKTKQTIASTSGEIYWKGTNETEFVQLIYMLFHSNLLKNEKTEITKLVNQVAEVFNYKLGKHWQSNLSSSKEKRKRDYKPEIIEKLSQAWKSYSEKEKAKI